MKDEEEDTESCVFWPTKGKPLTYEMFSVTQRREDLICLTNEDVLVVEEYVLEAKQVRTTCQDNLQFVSHYSVLVMQSFGQHTLLTNVEKAVFFNCSSTADHRES